jgi:molybdopterin molybdotransferase
MIGVEEALKLVLERIRPIGTERLFILDCLGRVCAEEVISQSDIPPFDNSAMDGFAVISADTSESSRNNPARLRIVEDVPAGRVPKTELKSGEAIRIMTGAPIPRGSDSVVMVEDTEVEGEYVKVFSKSLSGDNIRAAGEDVRKGSVVISKGTRLRPQEIGMAAAVGKVFLKVYKKPTVSILCTGDEIVDIDTVVLPGKIRNSNSYSLQAQIIEAGAVPVDQGIVQDNPQILKEKIQESKNSDMILISGGVSVGAYDIVKDVLVSEGMEQIFWKVAMKPGKPLLFGIIDGVPVFGLPGNPVSVMVCFEQFVRPSIMKMCGQKNIFKPTFKAKLKENIKRKSGRTEFIRAIASFKDDEIEVVSTGYQGSGVLSSMVKANCFIVVPAWKGNLTEGETVYIKLLSQGM